MFVKSIKTSKFENTKVVLFKISNLDSLGVKRMIENFALFKNPIYFQSETLDFRTDRKYNDHEPLDDFDDEEKVLVTPQKSKSRPKKKIKSESKEPSTPWWRRIFKKKKKPKSNVMFFTSLFFFQVSFS